MVEATFMASGKNMEEALDFTSSLISKLITGGIDQIRANKIDVFCIDINDANYLDERLWNEPEYGLISHNLVTNKADDLINIGYPGTKFVLGSDLILNLSPDMPKNLDGYKNFIQLVIMDGADLRERAANTWSKCKDLGLKTKFVESI